MAAEVKTEGHRVETRISSSLKKKFHAKLKKQNISRAQVIRDLIQAWVKA